MCLIVIMSYFFMYFFFFKQKTSYSMRISDWSSDVCSSDLVLEIEGHRLARVPGLQRIGDSAGTGLRRTHRTRRRGGARHDFDDVVAAGLVSHRLERPVGAEHDLRSRAGRARIDAMPRGCQVGDG